MSRQDKKLHVLFCRATAMTVALLLALALLPGRAFALSGTTGGLSWTLSGGTLTVSGSGAMPDYTDTNMPPWYDSASAINRIVVKEGVTSVGSLAFYDCESARSVTLGGSVAAIGDRAFKNCRSMTWLNLPEGLASIGEAAFESCERLNGILLPESLRVIGDYAFDRCTALTAITIPAGMEDAGRVVFSYCTGLTQANVLCPIGKLPDWYFYGCTALNIVFLPDTVGAVGERAFQNCENLALVYCSGDEADAVAAALKAEKTTRFAEVVAYADNVPAAMNTNFDADSATATSVTVAQTEGALITKRTETSYSYTMNGENVSLEDVLRADGRNEVTVTDESSTVIAATVNGSGGWKDIAATANNVSDSSLAMEIQLSGSKVTSEDISNLAETDAKLTISTDSGSTWVFEQPMQVSESVKNEEYDLDFAVDLLEKSPAGIESDAVYALSFPTKMELSATVGVPLQMSDAYRYATLYEKSGSDVVPLVTVQVDADGRAWFPVSGVSKNETYYVAIEAEGIDHSEAIIPDSLQENYGVEYVQTLTDASGKQYAVGERVSRWGITGRQFAIYASVIIGGVVLIVAGLMVTLNKISRSKAKYAALAATDAAASADIDEDELRLQVMQELLKETKKKNEAEQNK